MTPPPGDDTFINISNRVIYDKIIEMESQLRDMKTTFRVIAWVVAPIVSVVTSLIVYTLTQGG